MQISEPRRNYSSRKRLTAVIAVAAVLALIVGGLTSIAPGGAGSALAAGPSVTAFTASSPATVGSPVSFTASATSTSPIVAFNFTYGDGAVATVTVPTPSTTASVTATHTYTTPGGFVASVTATDSTTAVSPATATPVNVSLTGQRITASLTASPQQVGVGQTVTFTANASTPNTGALIQNLSLNFGDGTASQTLAITPSSNVTATATHPYSAPGTFTATLTATDNMGNLGQASAQVFVAPFGSVLGSQPFPYNNGYPYNNSYPYNNGSAYNNGYAYPNQYVNPAPVYTNTAPIYSTTPTYTATPAYSNVLGVSAINPANGISLSFPLGWSIVGGPNGTIVAGNIGPMYAFQPGDTAYEVVPNGSPLQSGWGYWAYFPTPATVVIPNVPSGSQTVQLPAGQFVMVGNPSSATATVSGADYMVTFNPSTNTYTSISQLPPGQGAWAFSFHGGTATITG